MDSVFAVCYHWCYRYLLSATRTRWTRAKTVKNFRCGNLAASSAADPHLAAYNDDGTWTIPESMLVLPNFSFQHVVESGVAGLL
jgi:hypothetical protein